MSYKLETGAPADCANRQEKEKRCYNLLKETGVIYERCDHPDANADTIEGCHEIEKVIGAPIAKNLFLCNRQRTNFYLLVMPGDKVFKTKELSGQLGCARLSFAGGEEMEEFLDITPGSVSILGLMNDHEKRVRLIVDEDILKDSYLCCHPCINTSTLKIKTKDVFEILVPKMEHEATIVKLIGEE